jgi:F-type H+-transporting ATPase subunit b
MKEWMGSCRRAWRPLMVAALSAAFLVAATGLAAYASGGAEKGEGEGANWINFAWRMANFVVLVWFLWWMMGKKAAAFFAGRRSDIKASLEGAAAAKAEAEQKFAEYAAKIDKASEEITGIIDVIKAQGLAEKEKILADARVAAEKIKEDSQSRMEQEFKKAKSDLRREAVLLSVDMAEQIVKRNIRPEDHKQMVEDSLNKVVNEQ